MTSPAWQPRGRDDEEDEKRGFAPIPPISHTYQDDLDFREDVEAMVAPYRYGRTMIVFGTALSYDADTDRLEVGIDGPPGRVAWAQAGGLTVPTDIAGRRVRLLKSSANGADSDNLYFDDVVP